MMEQPPTRHGHELRSLLADYGGMILVIVALIVFFSLTARNFLQYETFRSTANQIPEAIIAAVGMTFVLIIAGIDLSVGSVLALSSAAFALCYLRIRLPLPAAVALAVAACLGVGLACGAVNGLVTVAWRLPPFIVTLGMLQAARGLTRILTREQIQYLGPEVRAAAKGWALGLSLPFVVAVVVVVLGQLVLSRTVFGRYLVAIGTNEEAVRLSGIDPRPVKLAVFTLCGLLTSVAALAQSLRLGSAAPTAGEGFELDTIAAVVVGGTSLMGGRGSVVRSFFGVLIIAILGRGLVQLGARDPTKHLITGCVIVVAVIADYYRRRLARR